MPPCPPAEHGRAKLGGFSRAGRLEEVGAVSRQQRLQQAREQVSGGWGLGSRV